MARGRRSLSTRSLSERSQLLPTVYECEADQPEGWGTENRCVHQDVICHPKAAPTRVFALSMMSLLGFGSFFCFDNPGALQMQMEKSLNLTATEFSGLYSWYSWPNVILPVLGGQLIDRLLGVRVGTILFTCLLLAGQLILSCGAFINSLLLMKIGRMIFGVGGESLNMALNTYTVAWFKGKELNMVFGLQLSIARLGSTVNFLLMEPVYGYLMDQMSPQKAVGFSLLISSSFTFLSFICSLILSWLDQKREKYLKLPTQPTNEGESSEENKGKSRFPFTFWMLCMCTLAYYGSIFPFVSFAQEYFTTKFGYTAGQANFITGMVYLVAAVSSPIFGALIDRTGRNISWVVAAIAGSIFAHAILVVPEMQFAGLHHSFASYRPYFAVLLLGLMYSILSSALWSLAAIIVAEEHLATGYGIMQALQNLGTAVITMGAGYIIDSYDISYLERYFIGWLTAALLSAAILYLANRLTGGILNDPKQKEETDRRRQSYHRHNYGGTE